MKDAATTLYATIGDSSVRTTKDATTTLYDIIRKGSVKKTSLKKKKSKGFTAIHLKHFVDIGSAENFVDVGELLQLVRRKVRREHAVPRAPPPQQLACSTRRHRPRRPHCTRTDNAPTASPP